MTSPHQIQHWLTSLAYNPRDTMRTLPLVQKYKAAHCLEGAMAAAALLAPYCPPLILDLESEDFLDHTLFIFQQNGKWGAVGKSRDIGLDGRQPVFKSVELLARSYIIPYIDAKAHITSCGVLDLRTLPSQRWKNSRQNVWYVEAALRQMPHEKLYTPLSEVKNWRRRYIEFKQQHPKQQPDYFPGQHTWL